MILSILTPAVPSRFAQLQKLSDEVARQCHEIGTQDVEHLIFCDNKKRTVGQKRDNLLRMARGKYVAFVDDDDWIAPSYMQQILLASKDNPDVITFHQLAYVDALSSDIEFKLGNPNEPFNPDGTTRRNAWHVCAWRRTLAIQSAFPASNYGEDWAFAAPLCAAKNLVEVHIAKVLHEYHHSSKTTEAPPP